MTSILLATIGPCVDLLGQFCRRGLCVVSRKFVIYNYICFDTYLRALRVKYGIVGSGCDPNGYKGPEMLEING